MPLQRNEFLPQDLVTIYTSPSGLTDTRTGYPYQMGGLIVGSYFDLTEQEAQLYGRSQLHEGRYRFVQIDSAATASNIVQGSIGLMKTVALGVNVITSYDKGLNGAIRPVVFLNAPTAAQVAAGCYVFVQEEGDAQVLGNSTIGSGNSVGQFVSSTTGGTVNTSSGAGFGLLTIGVATTTPTASTLFRVILDLPPIQG
jgi:hypothetical protein